MKKSALLVILFTLIAQIFGQTLADRPVAVVKLHKTEVLPQTKFRRYEQTMKMQKKGVDLTLDEKKQLLDVLINQLLVRQDAAKLGISVSDEEVLPAAMQGLSMELQQMGQIPAGAVLTDPEQFKKLLVENGHDYDLYLENTRNSLLIEKYITQTRRNDFDSLPAPDSKTIEEFYNQNIAQFAQPEYVMVSQIFFAVKTGDDKASVKKKGEDLFRKITGGQISFDDAVKENGDDFPFTKIKGQPFTVARADAQAAKYFGQAFTNELFAGKEVSRIYFMESAVGFHIVKIADHKQASVLGVDDRINPMQEITVRTYLSQIIMNQMRQQLYARLQQEVVQDLRSRSEVNTFEDAL